MYSYWAAEHYIGGRQALRILGVVHAFTDSTTSGEGCTRSQRHPPPADGESCTRLQNSSGWSELHTTLKTPLRMVGAVFRSAPSRVAIIKVILWRGAAIPST